MLGNAFILAGRKIARVKDTTGFIRIKEEFVYARRFETREQPPAGTRSILPLPYIFSLPALLNSLPFRFLSSNDYGHMGEMILPAGGYGPRCSDPDSHAGDAALYCIDGPVTINLVDLCESFVLYPEDSFFIPAGTKYQLVNFESKPCKVVFAITAL